MLGLVLLHLFYQAQGSPSSEGDPFFFDFYAGLFLGRREA